MLRETSNATVAQETRLWIAVIMTFLLVEVGMHQFGHISFLWGLILAVIIFATTAMTWRNYQQLKTAPWFIVTALLGIIGLTILSEAVDLGLLGDVDLTSLSALGEGPRHGLLAITHVLSDFAVIGIGVYQLVRWYRLRNSTCALSGVVSFTACCGTTAVLLGAVLASALGVFGIHSGASFVMVAALLTVALATLAYTWAGRIPDRARI